MAIKRIADQQQNEKKAAWQEGDDPADEPVNETKKQKAKRMCKSTMYHLGLMLLVTLYCVGGAFMFQAIELDGEKERKQAEIVHANKLAWHRSNMTELLWSLRFNTSFEEEVNDLIGEYQNNVSEAVKYNGYLGIDFPIMKEELLGWSFFSALLFCITIVTTIGYGHVTPKTSTGQLVTIFYSLVGVPLMLMFLANIGELMARMFRLAYGRGCCYFCWKKRRQNYEYNRRMVLKARGELPRSEWNYPPENKKKGLFRRKYKRSPSPPYSTRSRSPSPVDKKKKKKKRRQSEEIDWDYLKTIDPDTIVCPDEEVINVPITLTLVVIAVYVFLGAVIFAAFEQDWSWIKGAYFSFVTLSTIGFGDLVPGFKDLDKPDGLFRLFAGMVYIILGLAVLSMSFNLMMEEMVSKFRWLGRKLGIVDDPEADELAATSSLNDTDYKSPRSRRNSRSPSIGIPSRSVSPRY